MTNCDWIKPGVRAVIAWSLVSPEYIDPEPGRHVTLTVQGYPFEDHNVLKGIAVLTDTYNAHGGRVACCLLRPIKEDDDSKETTTWEDIADLIGVDIRRVEEVA